MDNLPAVKPFMGALVRSPALTNDTGRKPARVEMSSKIDFHPGKSAAADAAPDAIHALVEGERPPAWRPTSWRLARVVDTSGQRFPLALEISTIDPPDFFDTEKIAAVWDREKIADGPRAVREGDTVHLDVQSQSGSVLEIWATDDIVSNVAVVSPEKAEQREAERQAEKESKDWSVGDVADRLQSDATNTQRLALVAAGFVLLGIGIFGVIRLTPR